MIRIARPWLALLLAVAFSAVLSACAGEPPPRVIPGPARDRILAPTPTSAQTADYQPGTSSVYVVEPGDYVASIAARFDTSIQAIVAANDLEDASRLEVGRQLIIPGASGVLSTPGASTDDSIDVGRPPVLPHAKATLPSHDVLTRIQQFVTGSRALPYVGAVLGLAALVLLVHLLASMLHALRLAAGSAVQFAIARSGDRRARVAGMRVLSTGGEVGVTEAPTGPGRLARTTAVLDKSARVAGRWLRLLSSRTWTAVWQRLRPKLESALTQLPEWMQGRRIDSPEDAPRWSARVVAEDLLAILRPALEEGWRRALIAAAHRSRFVAGIPYVRRQAGTSGLTWGMSGRVASPSMMRGAPTEQELEAALAAGDLTVHFRPVFRVGGGIAGAVAVLCWRHPLRGWTPADRLLDASRDDGGQRLLLRLLLAEASRFSSTWRRSEPAFRVTVGLSRLQFRDPELPALTIAELARAQLPADTLEFAVAERTALADIDGTVATFRRLRDVGTRLAIDDFAGTLGSQHLAAIAPDSVTVDFWGSARSTGARTTVAEVVAAARPFGMEVTAKRVETPDEVDLLRELECMLTWGDAFSGPVAPDRFGAAVQEAA